MLNTSEADRAEVPQKAIRINLRAAVFVATVKSIFERRRRNRYLSQLISIYRHRLSSPKEDFAELYDYQRAIDASRVQARFEGDRRGILAAILNQLELPCRCLSNINEANQSFVDIVSILNRRYDERDGCEAERTRCMLEVLCSLAMCGPFRDWSYLGNSLNALLGQEPVTATFPGPKAGTIAIGSQNRFANDRIHVIRAILRQVIQDDFVPRFYDYDYLDDIVAIIESRYAEPDRTHRERSSAILEALSKLATGHAVYDRLKLPIRLRELLGEDHGFVPLRGSVNPYVREVLPDCVDDFIHLRAENDVQRFLEINREYSRRQRVKLGQWDSRDLSLLREYETDHHLMLRTIVGLIRDGHVSKRDDVLLVGPRHVDEVHFFRKQLGLRKAIGLDLFDADKSLIIGGDMHCMPFQSNRFKLLYCAGTLSYSYNVRRVIAEMARVCTRPAYIFLIDAGDRVMGPDPLGRSDIVSVDVVVSLFYQHRVRIIARDKGKSLVPSLYRQMPCVALELI